MGTVSDAAVARHLHAWLGAWPPPDGAIVVVGSPRRTEAGWDGRRRTFVGVATPAGAVLSVVPDQEDAVRGAVADRGVAELDEVSAAVAGALGRPGDRLLKGVFRYSAEPADHPDAGVWLPADDPVVPRWMKPFGGEVLVALEDGRYVAGVGLKRHDPTGQEVAVVTERAAEGRGLARRLVSQAARRVVSEGAVVTYLHAPDNVASAHVAAACNFPDLGWRVLGLFPG